MARFQVVAVYPSGRRFDIRDAHETFLSADAHRRACERDTDPRDTWTYAVDAYYIGADGQTHWRGNVTGEDLGYAAEELETPDSAELEQLADVLELATAAGLADRCTVIRAHLARLERVARFNPAGAAPAISRLRATLTELEAVR